MHRPVRRSRPSGWKVPAWREPPLSFVIVAPWRRGDLDPRQSSTGRRLLRQESSLLRPSSCRFDNLFGDRQRRRGGRIRAVLIGRNQHILIRGVLGLELVAGVERGVKDTLLELIHARFGGEIQVNETDRLRE